MSTQAANRIKVNTARKSKPDATKAAKKAAKTTPAATKTQKTKTVTLNFERKTGGGKSVFKPANSKGAILTGLYVTEAALDLLDSGKQTTMDLMFAPHEKQPNNSFRFNEQGKALAVGSLYVMRSEAAKLGIDESSTVKLRIERPSKTSVKVTVSR